MSQQTRLDQSLVSAIHCLYVQILLRVNTSCSSTKCSASRSGTWRYLYMFTVEQMSILVQVHTLGVVIVHVNAGEQ